MVDMLIMLAITVSLGLLLLSRDKTGKISRFFDLEATGTLRGFWCIIVLLVHVPARYQNPIQDILGSFAYVGVTFFFMTSGYGLMLSIQKRGQAALKGFWMRRLPKLLIPMVWLNLLTFLADWLLTGTINLWTIVSVTGFVRQLLLFYFLFWLIFLILPKKMKEIQRIWLLCGMILAFSIFVCFVDTGITFWAVEALGFLYGIVLARHKDAFQKIVVSHWLLKMILVTVISIMAGILYLKTKHIVFLGNYVIKAVLCILITLLYLLGNAGFPLGNPVGRFLGKVSYEVYLLHGLVFTCFDALPGIFDSGVFILLSIVGTILLAWFVHKMSECVEMFIRNKTRL